VFVRFVTTWVDPDSQEAAGLFMAAQRLEYWDGLPAPDRSELCRLQRWFGDNLKAPTRLRRSRKPHRTDKAISWFRESATEHIAMANELVTVLERNGVRILALRTSRPGYVVYEDDVQVVAEPFNDTDRHATSFGLSLSR
jgi:hypothetical protein